MSESTNEQQNASQQQPETANSTRYDLIVHLVKVFNNGTNAAYSSTTVSNSILKKPLSQLRKYLVDKNILDGRMWVEHKRNLLDRVFTDEGLEHVDDSAPKERSEVNDTIDLTTYFQMSESEKEANVEKKADQPVEGEQKDAKEDEQKGGQKRQVTVYISSLN